MRNTYRIANGRCQRGPMQTGAGIPSGWRRMRASRRTWERQSPAPILSQGSDLDHNGTVPIDTLKLLIDLPCRGNLLADDALSVVNRLAESVEHVEGEEYSAPSAVAAAAWLARLAHQNADLQSEELPCAASLTQTPTTLLSWSACEILAASAQSF